MARANRHHISRQAWRTMHRCHKKEFVLKFVWDRKRWIKSIFNAKKRYGVELLNYTVTSNHSHPLVVDGERDVITMSLQLVEGKRLKGLIQPFHEAELTR